MDQNAFQIDIMSSCHINGYVLRGAGGYYTSTRMIRDSRIELYLVNQLRVP
jgi:hypothetical protein